MRPHLCTLLSVSAPEEVVRCLRKVNELVLVIIKGACALPQEPDAKWQKLKMAP